MKMLTKILLVTTTAALTAFGITGCAIGPTTRTEVCQQFDSLGRAASNANGFFDNPVFTDAGDLASTAGRYPGADLGGDAASLRSIANSDTTSILALETATTHIAALCGHPLGIGTTDFGNNDNSGNEAGGSGSLGLSGSGGRNGGEDTPATEDTPSYQDDIPTYSQDAPNTPANEVTDESSAQAALQAQVATDRSEVEALVGQWVPQLSSKTYGLVTNGVTYHYLEIWQDFESISQAHPGALLLWSGDYTSFQFANYYVTILPTGYSAGSQAAGWCTSNGLGANDCYGKLISHTAGPKGSSVMP